MKAYNVALIAACQFLMIWGNVLICDAATNFNGSTIVGIDQTERTITFRTRAGDNWTLPVNDPDLLKKERISPGDRVSIEIDLNDRITKILKPSDESPAPPSEPRDEASQ